ncbi:MAG: glucan biosynthesis protein G [Pseudomonadota bacterium]
MNRRAFLLTGTAAVALATGARADMPRWLSSEPFGQSTVIEMARDLATRDYMPQPHVPRAWQDLTYDEYRDIRFDVNRAIWARTDLPFRMDLFHPGLYFPRGVEVDVVRDNEAHRLAFDFNLFTVGNVAPDNLPKNEFMGYSGLRFRTIFEGRRIFSECAVFQGASYFRAIGADNAYGLSARGLALGTGDPEGEEFPTFTRFWVEEPAPDDETITVHALLDSPSVTGAYRYVIRPGQNTEMEAEATIFPRVDLDHVGLAPLTSMFLYDQTNRHRFQDFRPAIHDSDGLLIWNGAGEMLWRPLANPTTLQVSSFVDQNPRGFGLMQRADKLSDFADLEAHYHRRPSLWIVPGEEWGEGVVRLVEIPSDEEIYDNIVAYWRPRDVIPAGSEHRMSYKMYWGGEPEERKDVTHVLNTHMGLNFSRDRILAAIDFADHPALADLDNVRIFVAAGGRTDVSDGILQRNPETGGARLAFTFDPTERDAVELRAQLLDALGTPISEVWLYRWTRT